MILDLFTTTKYDNRFMLKHNDILYTVKDIKSYVAANIERLSELSNNVIIYPDNNFNFIINFFASVFANKNIYIITEKQKLKDFTEKYSLLNFEHFSQKNCTVLNEINDKNCIINFYTSGSTDKPKCIKKSLFNLISEGKDAASALNFISSNNLSVKSTTTMCHLFGMTFSLILPLFCGYIIDTNTVLYPENVDNNNCIFVTTPTFLNLMHKHSLKFVKTPNFIIASGAKLENNIFKYFESISSIVEIYGSTETGIIAYRRHSYDKLQIFPNVKLMDTNKVKSDYIYTGQTELDDILVIENNKLTVLKRKDKLIKINEKRVSISAIETQLNQTKYIDKTYCFKHKEKLACICVLNKNGKDFIIQNDKIKLEKHLKNSLKQISDIVPQRWRFWDEIPCLATGKVDKQYIQHIFNSNFSYPIILDKHISSDNITLKLFFYKNSNFYKGHFPNFPITPGVVQLYLANEFANYYFNKQTTAGQFKKIKFSNIIFPDSIINLSLTRSEKHIDYIYTDDTDKKYSSGTFLLTNIFTGGT